jgi:uncharacterized membrane protein YkvA (DUF1232 family)
MSRLWEALKQHGRALTTEITALYWAYRDPRTPWYARAWVVLVVAYALSPVDLIPDFVPILGYVDDLLLLPLGIWLALRLIPKPVIDAHSRPPWGLLCSAGRVRCSLWRSGRSSWFWQCCWCAGPDRPSACIALDGHLILEHPDAIDLDLYHVPGAEENGRLARKSHARRCAGHDHCPWQKRHRM